MKLVLGSLFTLLSMCAFAQDSCTIQIPVSLQAAIKQEFPGFRAPLESDSSKDAIAWDIEAGGTGCLGVASSDFDGDGKKDYLLGLTALHGPGALIIVAVARAKHWQFKKLSKWADDRFRLYVKVDKPGIYERTEALDGPTENGEVTPMACTTSVAVFGEIESTGVAYCHDHGKWRHVWISD